MVGKGGGNFYVALLSIIGLTMHEAATTGQFILFAASLSALIIFHREKKIIWSLAILIGSITSLSAFAGGYFSHHFTTDVLKIIFIVLLIIAGFIILIPFHKRRQYHIKRRFGFWRLERNNEIHNINLFMTIIFSLITGFSSGMVGISGGSFLVPLMVAACGVSIHTAVGTASVLIVATSFTGFAGHYLQGDFNALWALPLAVVTVLGGIIGSRISLKSKPKLLKILFASTNWLAAIVMLIYSFIV